MIIIDKNHHHVPHVPLFLRNYPIVRRILGVEEGRPVHRTRSCGHLPREWTVSMDHHDK